MFREETTAVVLREKKKRSKCLLYLYLAIYGNRHLASAMDRNLIPTHMIRNDALTVINIDIPRLGVYFQQLP